MKQLLIFPFNGNGLEALECLDDKIEFLGFVDDTPEKQGKHPFGFEVYSRDALQNFPEAQVLAVPGSPASYKNRAGIINSLGIPMERYATVVHRRAVVSELTQLGKNTLVMAGVVLTSNCKIGNHVCILPNTVIHHDSEIGDYSLIGSNVTVAGNTIIGENCYVGSGVSVINGIHIGAGSLVGIGSTVIRQVPGNSKVAGNPARILG